MDFKNGVKNIQTAGYNGARTVGILVAIVVTEVWSYKERSYIVKDPSL